jgi:flagellar biosynthetic protein FlhB
VGDEGKTEKPTAKRLRDARKEGQFPRTQDAAMWLSLAAALALLPRTADLLRERVERLLDHLPEVGQDPTPARALAVVADLPADVLIAAAPMCVGAAVAALVATAAQGVYPSTMALKPKMSRLSPKQGIKRMFGARALWEAVKALLKVTAVTIVLVILARGLITALLAPGLPLMAIVELSWHGLRTALWWAIGAGALLTLADYAYQRHSTMKQLRMSPRDIRDELKQSEGDPMLKGAIRSRQLAVSRNRMLSEVATANVVLVNPTHLAVALRYEPGRGAPRVIAKGAGTVAAKIRELAREHRVPVVEDKPLARALFRICDLGDEIPAELYLAVARILAFVMTAGKPGRTAGTRRPSHGGVPLPRLPSRGELRTRRSRDNRRTGGPRR